MEFRQKHQFNFKLLAKGKTFWKRAEQSVEKHKEDWKDAKRPALNV